MRSSFNGTTSRRALISGMTNTDQIGMWQAGPALAEKIPDVDTRGGSDDSGEERDPNTGLTAAEQAEFDSMRTGDAPPEPSGDDGADGDDAGDGDGEVPDTDDNGGADDSVQRGERAPGEKVAGEQQPARTPKTVNYSKYQRELKTANEKAAAAEARAQKLHEDSLKLGERVKMIDEALRAQPAPAAQQQEEQAPQNPFEEADIDPAEDYAAAVQQERRRNKFVYETNQQATQSLTESNEDRALKDTFERDFRSYAQTEPQIGPAYAFLKDSRLTEICITEFDKDPNDPNEQFTPEQVQRMVDLFNREEKWVVGEAIKNKKSPAAAIMKLARARGFKPAAAQAAAPAAQVPAKVPQRAPLAAQPREAPVAPNASEQLAQLRQNRDNGRSLSDGGGAPPEGLTAEMILRLGDDEFAEMVDGMSKHQLDALMGRIPT